MRYPAASPGEVLPRKPEPKAVQALHIRTQPGAGTLEAGLQRLRVPSHEQNPGAGPPDFLPWAPGYLGPRKVGLNPAWVCHGRLSSVGCPLLLLQLNTPDHQVQPGCLRYDLFVLLWPPDSSKELICPPKPFLPVTQPLPLGLPPAPVSGPPTDWKLGKKGLVRE